MIVDKMNDGRDRVSIFRSEVGSSVITFVVDSIPMVMPNHECNSRGCLHRPQVVGKGSDSIRLESVLRIAQLPAINKLRSYCISGTGEGKFVDVSGFRGANTTLPN